MGKWFCHYTHLISDTALIMFYFIHNSSSGAVSFMNNIILWFVVWLTFLTFDNTKNHGKMLITL